MRLSVRRAALITLNLSTTLLTLFTGLRENPLVVYVTGKYDRARARLHDGAINYDIIRRDLVRSNLLVGLSVVGDSYRLFTAPPRHFDNVGEDRSTCLRVNSINSSILNIYYNDFWGRAPRRTQVNLYSISPPTCDVVNFNPSWLKDHCYQQNAAAISNSAATTCHKYILDNFDALKKDRLIQTGVESDYGMIGAPFLRCQGRPEAIFEYKADMMVHQNYWAGGNSFIMFHSSDCLALPLVRDANWGYGLFKVQPMDDRALVLGAIDSDGYLTQFVDVVYAVVSLGLILRGIFAAVTQTREVLYVPHSQRFLGSTRSLKYTMPLMPVLTALATEDVRMSRT